MGTIIEIHRGKIEPTKDFVVFSSYIAFFPTILSGPIDKPNTFIPQLQKKRSFDYDLVVDGSRQILWGLFQKILIADNLAKVINNVWNDIPNNNGNVLIITAILYSFQLYTDFSGYSHMAIGIGKTLGIHITKNFNHPYFSRNISEFWRNWHMSLTSWLTDYVFMPLNITFRNIGTLGIILAIIINMLAVGLWHGPNRTFLLFGLYNGLLFIPLILSGSFFKKKKLKPNKYGFPTIKDSFKMVGTFMIVTFGFIFFRAKNTSQAWQFFSGVFDLSNITLNFKGAGLDHVIIPIIFLLIMIVVEWIYKDSEYPLAQLGVKWKRSKRLLVYYIILFAIIFWGSFEKNAFIYFKF